MTAEVLLLVVAVLQAKHFVCDGPLQSHAMVQAKGHYGRVLGLVHSGLHGLGSAGVLLAFATPGVALLLGVVDFLVHYHVDFTKETIVRRKGWTTQHSQFWWALSADQMLHQFTYLALALAIVRNA